MSINNLKTLILACALVVTPGLAQASGNHKVVGVIVEHENAGRLLAAMSRAKNHYLRNRNDELAQLTYARLLVKNGKPVKAIEMLKPLANQHGDDWRPWFWLGSAQLMNKQLDDAAWSMDEALAREGERVSIWVQRAVIEQERGNYRAAANMLQVADSIEPGNIDVLVNYAYALELSGELDKSTAVYRSFLKASAGSSEVGRLRSRVLSRLTTIESGRQQQQLAEQPNVAPNEPEASETELSQHDEDSEDSLL